MKDLRNGGRALFAIILAVLLAVACSSKWYRVELMVNDVTGKQIRKTVLLGKSVSSKTIWESPVMERHYKSKAPRYIHLSQIEGLWFMKRFVGSNDTKARNLKYFTEEELEGIAQRVSGLPHNKAQNLIEQFLMEH